MNKMIGNKKSVMKECNKTKSRISNRLLMIYIYSSNVSQPVTKTFTTLHPTTRHYFIGTRLTNTVTVSTPYKQYPDAMYIQSAFLEF
jgi:hypothetical protein